MYQTYVEITGKEAITISGNQLMVGTEKMASWKDDVTKDCAATLKFNDVPISSGMVPTAS